MIERMFQNRLAINRDLATSEERKYFSPALLAHHQILAPILDEWLRGDVLDIGAGDMPLREVIRERATTYHTLDVEERAEGIDYVADVQQMDSAVPADRYDTVLMLHVLEHVPDTRRALEQVFRVLKPGGALILSVPHLSRLHELPHDYYRFTPNGLKYLLSQAGFEVKVCKSEAGLFSFLGHQLSTLTLCSTWHLPVVKSMMFALNKWLVTRPAVWLDDRLDKGNLFALGHVVVAKKP
jgi:SAM-dependent methyltransferase